ncbi:hypothetical protein C6P40_005287 [Pichia californica]|uniref:Alternative oxidase n=1 Tax=Pichia californica TaxID=460514 RepID=A0A9P6WQ62_9ASCO|nr:hypothetical protein C6P42_000100 [[Candida] californica]KAG0691060.1 hypothetical protein C6P40_005287 [[Candida] californica]
MLSTSTRVHLPTGAHTIKLSKFVTKGIMNQITVQRNISSTKTSSTTIPLHKDIDVSTLPIPKNTTMVRLTTETEKMEGKYLSKPVYEHPGFDKDEMLAVKFEHRPVQSVRDAITYSFMKVLRHGFDLFTGYIEPRDEKHQIEIGKSPNRMTIEKWLTRIVVLESVAGIPGAVAGFLRHLHAMRLFKRDMAWIDTLYDEAFNERMHLLTFLKIAQPSIFTRGLLWVGQGIFANLFFVTYIFSPKTCHRFVGYLEEEAVNTYSRCIRDMELGLCPDLEHTEVPQIAKDYWHLSDNATMYDLIQYVRADEAKHREVNHTLANLQQKTDRNPFGLVIENDPRPQPHHSLKYHHAKGWEKNELIL